MNSNIKITLKSKNENVSNFSFVTSKLSTGDTQGFTSAYA